jgi:DNA-binding CsgD family transcriptional regulator
VPRVRLLASAQIRLVTYSLSFARYKGSTVGEDLIERSSDLALIEGALSSAERGDGSLTLVSGPAGVGKTALLDAARELGRSRGVTALDALATELEAEFPYGVVRQLYAPTVGEPSRLEEHAAVAAIFARPGRESAVLDVSFQVLDGLYWLVSDMAQEVPLLVLLDDLQWCDEPSLRHLLYLSRRLDGMPAAIVLAQRDNDRSRRALADLQGLAATRIEPAPLSVDGVAELVRRVFGSAPSAGFASACLEQTGGLPLYLEELLRVARERGIRPDDNAAAALEGLDADRLGEHVWRRIEAAGANAATVAGLVAVLGSRATPGRIGRLAGFPAAEVAGIVAELSATGVLGAGDPPRFAHPVVDAAVRARLSPERLDLWNRCAARLLDSESADVREVAAHLMKCHPQGEAWAVERLRESARSVLGRGAPESAALALRRALAEPPAEEARVLVLRELARAEDAVGEPEAALAHLDDALRLASEQTMRAEIAVAKAQILSQLQRSEASVAALLAGLDALDGSDSTLEQRLDAELITHTLISTNAIDRKWGLQRLASYGGLVPEGPAAQAVLTTMTGAAVLSGQPAPEVAALAERALRAGGFRSDGFSSEVWTIAAWLLVDADRPDLARSLTERELPVARRDGHRREIYVLEGTLALAALRCGDIPEAVARAETALAVADRGPHQAWGHGFKAVALFEAGDLAGAERAFAATSPEHWSESARGSFGLHYARALLRLEQGRLQEAEEDLEAARHFAQAIASGLRTLENVWRPAAAMLAHRQGRVQRARTLAAEALDDARQFEAVGYVGPTLRTVALVGEPGEAIDLLRESVEILAPSPFRLEHARSLVELGAALRRSGERTAAREPLADGLDLAYRCGAGATVSRAREELRASGARPRRAVLTGAEALTAAETRMARLAADGRTNREIARELYVTLKTVEGTLGRAYAKLGISGRGARDALPEALAPLRPGS